MYNNLRNCSAESFKDWFIIRVNIIENIQYLNQIENREKHETTYLLLFATRSVFLQRNQFNFLVLQPQI